MLFLSHTYIFMLQTMIYLGADHRGFALKEEIKKYFDEDKIPYEDMGAFQYDTQDDYPDFALAAAKKMSADLSAHRGIIICGSGMGVNIAANKVKGVYSALVWSAEAARALHAGQSNVLALPADFLNIDQAREIIKIWMNKDNEPKEERHERRLEKIKEIENKK